MLRTLEDVSELAQLDSLLPICAFRKKVRSGEEYGEAFDAYLPRRLRTELTHSICEQRLEKRCPDAPPAR